jgi:hypothetical protein
MTDAPAPHETLADALRNLVGGELSSVVFVRDYIQLDFDGPCLSAYTPPTVTRGSESLSLGQAGYRDSLCAQIGCRVERTEVVVKHRVSIVFDSCAVVSISLLDNDYRGPEALEFSLDRKNRTWVV